VAPERIQKGIAESLSVSDQTFLGKSFGSSFKYLMVLRYQWDAINYQWIRWVLNYDSGLQSSLFDKFLKDVNPLRIALLLLGAGAISMIFIFTILFFRYRHKKLPLLEHFAQKFYLQLCQKLKRCGLVPDKGESLRHFVLRAANERPDLRRALTKIADLYEQLVYAENTSVLLALKDELASFSPSNKPIIP
jgi:protein-glutamine gamma-glutamyltransferase